MQITALLFRIWSKSLHIPPPAPRFVSSWTTKTKLRLTLVLCWSFWIPLSKTLASSWASVRCGLRNGGCTSTVWWLRKRPRYLGGGCTDISGTGQTRWDIIFHSSEQKKMVKSNCVAHRREEGWPGGLGSAQDVRNIPQAAVGERVDTSPKLSCHL